MEDTLRTYLAMFALTFRYERKGRPPTSCKSRRGVIMTTDKRWEEFFAAENKIIPLVWTPMFLLTALAVLAVSGKFDPFGVQPKGDIATVVGGITVAAFWALTFWVNHSLIPRVLARRYGVKLPSTSRAFGEMTVAVLNMPIDIAFRW